MGTKVENCKGLGSGPKGYLFFGNELDVGVTPTEEHKNILAESGKTPAEVSVAGQLLVSRDEDFTVIVVDGKGSGSLKIEPRDPTPVVKFIKNFPDACGKDITPSK